MAKFWGRKKTKDTEPEDVEVSEPDVEVTLEPTVERIAYRRLWKAGLAAAVLAAVANLFVYGAAVGTGIPLLVPAPSDSTQMIPMSVLSIILVCVFATLGAILLLAFFGIPYLQRRLPRPTRILWGIAAVVWFFSLAGPLSLPVSNEAKAVMCLMHTVTTVVITGMLTLFGRERRKK
jgi:hypothetical protein